MSTRHALDRPVIVLTIPKSGTHLLANLLRAIVGPHLVRSQFLTAEEVVVPGLAPAPLFIPGHVPFTPATFAALRPHRKLLLVRDPRDIVVSLARAYLSRKVPPDAFTAYVEDHALTLNELLTLIITGGRFGSYHLPDINAFVQAHFLAWQPHAAAVLRYEDLLLEGNDSSRAEAALREAFETLGIAMPADDLGGAVRRGSAPETSATFDQGRAGRWREYLSPQHLALFGSVAPGLLESLGYEAAWSGAPSSAPREPAHTPAPDLVPSPASPPTRDEFQRLRQRVETNEQRLFRIKSLDEHVHQRVSFVSLDALDLGILVWTDDTFHKSLNQMHYTDEAFRTRVTRTERGVARVRLPRGATQPLTELARPLLDRGRKVHVVDVGSFYGVEPMLVAGMLGEHGDRLAVSAFDCGWAGRLAPHNFELNGLGTRIRFDSRAVSDVDRTQVVFGEYTHTENMRIVNRNVNTETVSYPVPGVRLDSAFASAEEADFVLKIDVQGAEPLVLAGAGELTRRCRAMIIKFIPHAVSPLLDEPLFHTLIPTRFSLFDLGYYNWYSTARPRRLERRDFPDFARRLRQSTPIDYTFLLAVYEA